MNRLIVAVTGASGSIYAKLLLDKLLLLQLEGKVDTVDIVFSQNGKEVWMYETGTPFTEVPFTLHNNNDFYVPLASGSSLYDTMFVCPCSMGTMGRIANGLSDTLITRAADVMLKERRRLILSLRETPMSLIHINNMQVLAQAGAIIAPASPSFYSCPQSIEELAMTVVDRLLQLAGLETDTYRWGKEEGGKK